MCLFFFFFSSRRRHTRSLRDWSSDVCSSDLIVTEKAICGAGRNEFDFAAGEPAQTIFRSEEHTSELQSRRDIVCCLLLEKKKRGAAEAVTCSTLRARRKLTTRSRKW